eukprot:GCRY01005383.1.p1 GENE.GCRY01005383.1~~GCRY01005383.1.p1  ORF type:complete len:179 (+),score=43.20 GCRY01005383.1:76-612(+)
MTGSSELIEEQKNKFASTSKFINVLMEQIALREEAMERGEPYLPQTKLRQLSQDYSAHKCQRRAGEGTEMGETCLPEAQQKWSFLHHVVAKGDEDTILFHLKTVQGSVDEQDSHGRSPLHWAASRGMVAVVARLINLGATVCCVDKNNALPLHYAAKEGHSSVLELLASTQDTMDKED